jgi:hypothetical protein
MTFYSRELKSVSLAGQGRINTIRGADRALEPQLCGCRASQHIGLTRLSSDGVVANAAYGALLSSSSSSSDMHARSS